MSIIELNGNLNEMQEYEALPSNLYPAIVRDVEIRTSEKVPNGYFYIQCLIDPENFPADYDVENAPEGLNVAYARVAVPDPENRRTIAPIKNLLEALGLPTDVSQINTEEWINRELQVDLKCTEYQGAPTNNVEGVAALPKV